MSIEISVVVPFLNEERYIRQCVDSLLAAEYPPDRVEFLFVDNGSSDRGPAIVREYSRIKLLTVTDGAVYTARNAALEVAQGEVIAFTDADCAVAPGWLEAIREETLDRGASFVMGAVRFPKPCSALLEITETYRNDHIEFVIENRIWQHVYGYTNNMAVRADVFERLGPFQELPVPGDTEILHRCLRDDVGARVAFRRDMWVNHLELLRLRTMFRKQIDYGGFEMHLEKPRLEMPRSWSRYAAETYSLRKNSFTLRKRLLFWFVVHTGTACFGFGKWRARLRRALRRTLDAGR